jgi:superfamily I DNA and/or RNA helicase
LLVCAPSNIAVDTILSRVSHALEHIEKQASVLKSLGSVINLPKLKNQMVRIGHPARVSTSILHYTLDYLISIDEVNLLFVFLIYCIDFLSTEN